jgi:serine/threonine protein kinase
MITSVDRPDIRAIFKNISPTDPDEYKNEVKSLRLVSGMKGVPWHLYSSDTKQIIIMSCCGDGITLEAKLYKESKQHKPTLPQQITCLVNQKLMFLWNLSDTIGDVHHKLLMHGDLKLSNVICGANYEYCYLIDLGLSCVMVSPDAVVQRSSFQGSHAYASPSALNPMKHEYSLKCDWWGFGWIAVELMEPKCAEVKNWSHTADDFPERREQREQYTYEKMMKMYDSKTKTVNYVGSNMMRKGIITALFTNETEKASYNDLVKSIRKCLREEIDRTLKM